MAKLSGQYINILLDNASAAAKDISSWCESVEIPQDYQELDVTSFGDGAINSIAGMPSAGVEITGGFDPATGSLYSVAKGVLGASGGTLTVQVGQGAAPTSGDPEFEGEFWVQKMNLSATPTGKIQLTVSLRPYGTTPAAWGTMT